MSITPTTYLNVQAGGLTPSGDSKSTLDKDGFLKLLTAQLRNQDPQGAQDPTEYFNTISQMTVVEQLTNLAGNSSQSLKQQEAANSTAMIGRNVSYKNAEGTTVTGVLESVQIGRDAVTVTIAGVAGIKPSAIMEVS